MPTPPTLITGRAVRWESALLRVVPVQLTWSRGLATAHMDSSALVAITGNVPTSLIGTDAFQEADVYGITGPVTKHNYLVKDIRRPAQGHQGGVSHRLDRASGSGLD